MSALNGSDISIVEEDELWFLRLYVAGQSPRSLRAFANLSRLCEEHLAGRYQLSVVDVHEDPAAVAGGALATPTLVRTRPLPLRKVVGDLSHTGKVLLALELPFAGPQRQS